MHPRNSKTLNLFIKPNISPSIITGSHVSLHAKVFLALASVLALCNGSPTTHAQDAPKNSKNEAILLSEFIYESAPFPSWTTSQKARIQNLRTPVYRIAGQHLSKSQTVNKPDLKTRNFQHGTRFSSKRKPAPHRDRCTCSIRSAQRRKLGGE